MERWLRKRLFRRILDQSWGITTKKQLLTQINFLLNGTNSEYANIQLNIYYELREKNLEISSANIRRTDAYKKSYYSKKDDADYLMEPLRIIQDNAHLLTPNGVYGFDIARTIHLVRMGYVTKILSISEAWKIIDDLYPLISKFNSYYDYFASNELGNMLFDFDRTDDENENLESRFETLFISLCDKRSPMPALLASQETPEKPLEIIEKLFGSRLDCKKAAANIDEDLILV